MTAAISQALTHERMVSDLALLVEKTTSGIRMRTLRQVAAGLDKAMATAFRVQGRRFTRHFERKVKPHWPQAKLKEAGVLQDGVTAAMAAAARETQRVFVTPIQAAASKCLAAGGNVLIAQLDLAGSFSLKNPRAVAYLEAHGAELVAGINDTTRDAIQSIVTQGVDEGWSYNRTAQAISTRFREFAVGRPQDHIDSRAHLVAVTESGNAYMAGQQAVVGDLMDAGLSMEKAWATIGDDKVSEGCQANEAAGWIAADENFPSGDPHPLRFPGCRCDVRYRRAGSG